jgi:hypothetical protein
VVVGKSISGGEEGDLVMIVGERARRRDVRKLFFRVIIDVNTGDSDS